MTRTANTTRTATPALMTRGLALVVVATLLSGCMGSETGGVQKSYKAVQSHQFADPSKECGALRAEVAQIDADIAGIDRKIRGMQTAQSAMSLFSSFGSMGTNQRALASFGQTQSGNEAYRLEDVKRSYQTRRDTLFRGFVNKGCRFG